MDMSAQELADQTSAQWQKLYALGTWMSDSVGSLAELQRLLTTGLMKQGGLDAAEAKGQSKLIVAQYMALNENAFAAARAAKQAADNVQTLYIDVIRDYQANLNRSAAGLKVQ